MKVNAKRTLALFLAVVMTVGMIPISIFATVEPGFSVTAGGAELTATDCGDDNWLLTAPEDISELTVSLKDFSGEYFFLQSPNPNMANSFYSCNSWGDGDMESFEGYVTYDGETYCLDLLLPYIKCTVKDTIEKFGFTMDSTATYYYFSVYDGDTFELMYNLLIKAGGFGESVAVSATPVISKQPISAKYELSADAIALTVTASVSDGMLTYAWCADSSNTVLSTEAQYIPSTETVGSKAYYVIVTNTEYGKTPTSVTSEKATVTVTEPVAQAPAQNADGVYQLGSGGDLFWFAEKVNSVTYSSGSGWSSEAWIDAELTADIDLEDAVWTPIGTTFYAGHFNGNGFTVSGLNITVDSDEYPYVGFFADVEEAVIEDLKLSGTITVTEDGTVEAVGGIAGYVYSSELSNCRSDVDIVIEQGGYYVGGLIGFTDSETTTVKYCASIGDITMGYADYAGGLIGYSACEELLISYCYQKGNVYTEATAVGGFIGISEDSALTVEHSYVSASLGKETLPSGLEQNGTITGEYVGDLFGLLYAGNITFDGVYCVTEIIDGENNYVLSDFDENSYSLYTYCGTPEGFLSDLNSGDDNVAYTIVEGGDGWPILAWELKDGISPGEQEKALTTAKEAAEEEIMTLFTDTYKEADYEAADWTKMISYRDKALVNIEEAKNQDAIDTALGTLKTDLQSVLTVSEKLDDYKKTACTAIEKAYYYQTVGAYSVSESGYKVDLTEYIAGAEKFGLMHDLREWLLSELNSKLETLEQKKNGGLAAVNAAVSKSAVDIEKANALSDMEQILTDAKAITADNGVADKWDGTTKTQPSGLGTKAFPYQISNGAELAWFADKVNNGDKNLCATLTADIDLNEKAWTPISKSTDDNNGYAGVFDGDSYRIHGLSVTVEKEENRFYGGLFGNIGKSGVVKNISVAGTVKQMLGNSSMSAIQKSKYTVGGIAGRSSGIVYNCESSVVLTNGATYSDCNFFGGIIGYQAGGIIENCTSYAILYKNGSANFQSGFGGVAGYSNGNSLIRYTDSYAEINLGNNVLSNIGGIVGTLTGQAQIRECRHFGTVVNGSGIAGNVLEQAGIAYALNSGTVSGKNGIGESGIRPAAGIIGVLNSTGTVSYIYNNGNCQYGLVNDFKNGTVVHAQSSSETSLWGTADAQNAFTDDCLKISEIEEYESTELAGALVWVKLEATLTLLDNLKSSTDKIYGTQSVAYNAVVLQLIRMVELAKTADEIALILTEAKDELNMVRTQLEAEKESVILAFESYVAERVYDEIGTIGIKSLLEKAKVAAEMSETLSALSNIKEEYLGTDEQPGKFETECDTYNTKAKNELYNEFIYEKKYSDMDMAAILSLYEIWAVRIDSASSVEKIDTAFANARFALNEASSKLTETDVAPDMDTVANAALTLAKEAAAKELFDLAESCKFSMKALVDSTDGKSYADGILTAIRNVKISHDTYMNAASAADFSYCTDYAQVEVTKSSAAAAMREYAAASVRSVNDLIDEAEASSTGTWDGTTVTEPKKAEDEVYQISNGAELAWLAQELNAGHFTGGNVNAVLTHDIDLGYNEWTPIGIDTAYEKAFAGSFDGNGFTIRGLYFSTVHSSGYTGLFGVVRNDAEIKNLTVRGTFQLATVSSGKYIGGIVAMAYREEMFLKNCVSYVEITVGEITNTAGQPSHIGGLVGYVHSYVTHVDIADCAFHGSVAAEKCNTNTQGIGGIVGKIEGETSLVRNVNYGEIAVDKAVGVGGIVGRIAGYGAKAVTFVDCANLGSVANDTGNVMDSKGGTGGIAGVVGGLKVMISGCYNTGTIAASKIAGGILGSGGSLGHESELIIENCYNAGTLDGPNNQTASKIGALIGYPIDGEYKDGLYVLEGSAQAAMGWKSAHGDRIYAVSADELIKQFAVGANMVKSIADLNKGYPLFAWQLLDDNNRQAVIDYLNEYFESDIKDFASVEQKKAILKILDEQSSVILAATAANTIIAAYETAMKTMDKETLLGEAKSDALKDLDDKIREYLLTYPELTDKINALKDAMNADIESAESPSDTDTIPDKLDAAVVDLLIADIGEIDNDLTEAQAETVKEKIAIAEDAYNSLSDIKKQQVSKFITLSEAKAAINTYEDAYAADKAAADVVTEKIKAIGDVTLNSRDTIETALNGYNYLTDKQKAMVSEEDHNMLLTAQTRYNELVVAYNANVKATQAVINSIGAIGTVTLDSKDAITAAINGYNALTDSQKKMIPEEIYNTMQAASKKYGKLVAAYNDDVDAVAAVVNKINAIGTVTLNSGDVIAEANSAYCSLTDSQKAMVADDLLSVLALAEAKYDALAKAGGDASENTGTSNVPDNTTGERQDTNVPDRNDKTDDTSVPDDTSSETDEIGKVEDITSSDSEPDYDNRPVSTIPSEKSFDQSIAWIICAIVGVALIAVGMIHWFVIATNKKRK